jgi:hypothetical protein
VLYKRWWILVNDQRDRQIIFYVFISIYNSPHVSSTSCSSSGETNCINTASGNSHSVLVDEMCAGWKKALLPTCTHLVHQHRMTVTRGCIDTICLSWRWALCARNMSRVIYRKEYIEKNSCITLVIYQESLRDARSTKCKILQCKIMKLPVTFFSCSLDMPCHLPHPLEYVYVALCCTLYICILNCVFFQLDFLKVYWHGATEAEQKYLVVKGKVHTITGHEVPNE